MKFEREIPMGLDTRQKKRQGGGGGQNGPPNGIRVKVQIFQGFIFTPYYRHW